MDGHIRGTNFVAQSLYDARMEVIHLGRFNSPEAVAQVALEQDMDVVDISALSNEYREYLTELCGLLDEGWIAEDTLVVLGGTDSDDEEMLSDAGVDRVFGQQTNIDGIVEYIETMA